jgi:hypothetical protein
MAGRIFDRLDYRKLIDGSVKWLIVLLGPAEVERLLLHYGLVWRDESAALV